MDVVGAVPHAQTAVAFPLWAAGRVAPLAHTQESSIMSANTTEKTSLTQRPAWKALGDHYEKVKDVHLRQLFADDPKRGETFAIEDVGLYFDYSKHRVTEET